MSITDGDDGANPIARLPFGFARSRGVIISSIGDDAAEVMVNEAIVTPEAIAEVRRALGRPLKLTAVDATRFEQSLAQLYAQGESGEFSFIEDVERDLNLQGLAKEMPRITDLLESGDEAPIIRLLNALLTQALREKASDIHLELFESRSVVRFRVDGILRDILEPPRLLHTAIVSRVKVMASLDIAEKRLPQDGRITLRLAGRPIDVRISVLPTGHGERVVLRLLDKMGGVLDLKQLGMSDKTCAILESIIKKPHGVFLVTGPTGSGKTTTLYAALSKLAVRKLNLMTVEDPIEYDLDGVNQTQVNAAIEMTFARALRSILRQDPDVIMIGEIRDLETAQIAVQASLTGHLVIATLHTNDSVGAVTRLVDMGVEPFLLASSLLGVLAQRLVRRLCPHCKTELAPDLTETHLLGADAPVLYEPAGCDECKHSGFQGRSGIFELFVVDDDIRRLIHDEAPEHALRHYIKETQGVVSLRQDALRLAAEGGTSLEEALRVTEG